MPASSCIVGSCSRTTLESSQRCHSNHIVNAAPDESDLAPTCEHGMNVGIPSSSSEIKKKIMEPVPHLVAMSPRPVTTGVCQLGAWRPFSHDLKTVGIFSINSFNVYHWATSPQHKLKVLLHYVTTSDSHFVTRCYL